MPPHKKAVSSSLRICTARTNADARQQGLADGERGEEEGSALVDWLRSFASAFGAHPMPPKGEATPPYLFDRMRPQQKRQPSHGTTSVGSPLTEVSGRRTAAVSPAALTDTTSSNTSPSTTATTSPLGFSAATHPSFISEEQRGDEGHIANISLAVVVRTPSRSEDVEAGHVGGVPESSAPVAEAGGSHYLSPQHREGSPRPNPNSYLTSLFRQLEWTGSLRTAGTPNRSEIPRIVNGISMAVRNGASTAGGEGDGEENTGEDVHCAADGIPPFVALDADGNAVRGQYI